MKNRIFVLLACIFSAGLLFAQSEKQNISKLIDEWHQAAATTNFEAYFERMTSDAVFIGTDASENWQLEAFKTFSKPYFDKGKAWSFSAVERNIYIDPTQQMAWFDELLDTWMGICRGSGVVRNDNGNWKIAHYVLSATVPNDDMGQLIEIKKEKDSLQILQLKSKYATQPNKK